VPAQQFEKARFSTDGLKAVQQDDRATRAATQNFELDPVHPQPPGIGVRHRMRPPANLQGGFIAVIEPVRNGGSALTEFRCRQGKTRNGMRNASVFGENRLYTIYLSITCGAAWQPNFWRVAAE
jgi:hypothetical protein